MAVHATSPKPPHERHVPSKPDMKKFKATFNGETITGNYLLLDARSPGEKAFDKDGGCLKGPIIVFFQGHGQRPKDCYEFTKALALKSLSGICIVPTCDTPFGDDQAWRGDRGKMVILMAAIRHFLDECGVSVEGFRPITEMPSLINGFTLTPKPDNIPGELCSIGWSHGGILAREFASKYPSAVIGLATVCSGGYKQWNNPGHLLLRFALEAVLSFKSGQRNNPYSKDSTGITYGAGNAQQTICRRDSVRDRSDRIGITELSCRYSLPSFVEGFIACPINRYPDSSCMGDRRSPLHFGP